MAVADRVGITRSRLLRVDVWETSELRGEMQRTEEQQCNSIDTVLEDCLNWQETASMIVGRCIREIANVNVDNVSKTALQKISFLQDALIYSLRNYLPCGEETDEVRFDSRNALEVLLRKDPPVFNERLVKEDGAQEHGLYYYVRAISRLFRARMKTRIGGPHGLAWGSHFNYPLSTQRYKLVRARKECFVGSLMAESDATKLAKQLLISAKKLVDLHDELSPGQFKALRDAVVKDKTKHKELLEVWRKGNCPTIGLPMDKLWTRSADCVYTKHCIGYDEFVAKEIKFSGDDDCRHVADLKLEILREAEEGWKEDWKNVVRNWWCCGFTKGIYSWRKGRNKPVVVTSGRSRDLRQDATSLVDLVSGEDEDRKAYQRVRESLPKEAGMAKKIVRLACEGKKPDPDILKAAGTEREKMYAILFLVATAPTKPKLQDCWRYSTRWSSTSGGDSA